MHEINGDLFELAKGGVLVITTNGTIKNDGTAVMGAGCAKQASKLWPFLPREVGDSLRKRGTKLAVYHPDTAYQAVVAFPVKYHWFEAADPSLIYTSAVELRALADGLSDWKKIYVPRPGCGNGKLEWKNVKPALEDMFDERFIVVDF